MQTFKTFWRTSRHRKSSWGNDLGLSSSEEEEGAYLRVFSDFCFVFCASVNSSHVAPGCCSQWDQSGADQAWILP